MSENYNTDKDPRRARFEMAFPVFSKWYYGWRGFYDNPFAQYLLLQERRQREARRKKYWGAKGWYTRVVLGLILLVVLIKLVALPLLDRYRLTAVEQWAMLIGVVAVPLFMVWFVSGIYHIDRFCLSVQRRSNLPRDSIRRYRRVAE